MTLWNRIMAERAAHERNMNQDEHWPDTEGVALCRLEPSIVHPKSFRLTWFANQMERITCPQCKRAARVLREETKP